MSHKHLSRKPHKIRGNENVWWYEEVKGMQLFVHRDAVIYQDAGSVQVTIPWEIIRRALARKDKQ